MYGRDCHIPGHYDMHEDNFENEGRERLIYDLDKLITAHRLRDTKILENLKKMNEEIIHTMEAREFKGRTELEYG